MGYSLSSLSKPMDIRILVYIYHLTILLFLLKASHLIINKNHNFEAYLLPYFKHFECIIIDGSELFRM